MVRVGIIGIGFMGVTHYKALQSVKGARVTAICTRDQRKLGGDWRKVRGNFGDSGGVQDLTGVARYGEPQELIADPNIDLVDICLPTELHRSTTIAALKAGKHVLVEKPIAVSLADADAMIAAARRAERLLMVAQVLRFFPPFAEARALVHSGEYGALLGAHLKRVISRPDWGSGDHFDKVEKSGGPVIDLHIHDTDFVHYLAGVPERVQASGVISPRGSVEYLQSHYLYGQGGPCVTAQSGAIAMRSMLFEHGFDIYLEKATLHYNNLTTGAEVWLFPAQGKKKALHPKRKEAFTAQLQHAVDCVKKKEMSPIIDAASARTALHVCLKERQAVLTGKVQRV